MDSKKPSYIPKDLDDAIRYLKENLLDEDLLHIRKMQDENQIHQLHFTWGMGMRNDWRLWDVKTSRLAQWFNSIGIEHPDDMSGIIMTSMWRTLHNKPRELEKQVKYYQDYWASVKVQHVQDNTIIGISYNDVHAGGVADVLINASDVIPGALYGSGTEMSSYIYPPGTVAFYKEHNGWYPKNIPTHDEEKKIDPKENTNEGK